MTEANTEQCTKACGPETEPTLSKGNSKQNPVKGKAPENKKESSAKSVPSEDLFILQCLKEIQTKQHQYNNKVDSIWSRVKKLEEAQQSYEYPDEYYGDPDDGDVECEEGEIDVRDSVEAPSQNSSSASRFGNMA